MKLSTSQRPRPRLVDGPDFDNILAIDSAILPIVCKMERAGMRVNLDKVRTLDRKFANMQADVELGVRRLIGNGLYTSPKWKKGELNLKSGDQVAELLFSDLGVDSSNLKMTSSGSRVKVDGKTLEKLSSAHPIIPLLLEHSKISKLRDAFTRKMRLWVDPDGRVRSRWQYTRTATGRFAAKTPNLTQIPTRTILHGEKVGAMVRACFEPDDGCVLISVDQSQIEMRVGAHESNDESMMQIFIDNDDMHWRVAEKIHGKPRAELDASEHRSPIKNCNFGIFYGITAPGLYDQIIERIKDPRERAQWSVARCQQIIDEWFAAYPGVREMLDRYERRARTYGYVWNMFGRVRWTPGVRSVHPWIVSKTLREIGNMPIQSGACETLKIGAADVHGELEKMDAYESITCRCVALVHDEMLIECSEEIAEEVGCMVQHTLENAVELRVPVTTGMSIGTDWGQLK